MSITFSPQDVPSPSYVIDLELLEQNLRILSDVKARSGAHILLALKGYACWSTFDLVGKYLDGVTASSPWEAELGKSVMGKQVHAYAPAYSQQDLQQLIPFVDHLVFNSVTQFEQHEKTAREADIQVGIRINPQHSEVKTPLYDPCAPGSRLGVTREQLEKLSPTRFDGIHFHTLCELGSDALSRTLRAVKEHFAPYLHAAKWVNFGGGHHITRADYDTDLLVQLITDFQDEFGCQVILEPGEAIALNAGFLVASVLDIVDNNGPIAILDTSASAHMPDVLEMPYRPHILGSEEAGIYPHTYRLGGLTCLAGDMIGSYSFKTPLSIGDRLVFTDMAHYSMVKNTTFNGVKLPAIVHTSQTGVEVIRQFTFDDYKSRLS